MAAGTLSFLDCFDCVEDPRLDRKKLHGLIDVLFISVAATVAGADGPSDIEEFATEKIDWCRKFVPLGNGVPSHDTIGRVIGLIRPLEFQKAFLDWVASFVAEDDVSDEAEVRFVAIDGKTARGSHSSTERENPLHIVSAWASQQSVSLGQVAVDEKSNEITAIPKLLQMLELAGAIVSIDAMGCQKEIVNQIDMAGADATISLKGNQGRLHADTVEMFAYFDKIGFEDVPHSYHREVSSGHGRIDIREIWTFSPHAYAQYFRTLDQWTPIQTVSMVRSERRLKGKVEQETRYFISTLTAQAKEQLRYIRRHWGIENELHWVLDVAFQQDAQRTRKANSAANLVTLHHMVLNLLRLDKSKGGIETKRLKCGWDTHYRMCVLAPILSPGNVN